MTKREIEKSFKSKADLVARKVTDKWLAQQIRENQSLFTAATLSAMSGLCSNTIYMHPSKYSITDTIPVVAVEMARQVMKEIFKEFAKKPHRTTPVRITPK